MSWGKKRGECPCGRVFTIKEGTLRQECPWCGRVFGKPPIYKKDREAARYRRQQERRKD